MADARLSVEVGAKLDQLNTGFANAVKIVEAGATQLDNSSKKVERSFKILNDTKFTFGASFQTASAKLANEAAKTGAVLGGSLSAGSNRAAFALQNLGRVAQDAPFGFIGIQNNLNPLLESFAMLRKETGSNGAALKALGSSLIGPAGLGIALSLVSAGILLYQEYQRKATKAAEEAEKATKDYAESLNLVQKATLKGNQDAQTELITLRLLYETATNVAASTKARQKATDDLQSKYPEYFKSIDDETIKLGGAKLAYDKLATSILASARARAGIGLLSENAAKELTLETQINDAKAAKLRIDKLASLQNAVRVASSVEETENAKKAYFAELTRVNILDESSAIAVQNIGKIAVLQARLNTLKNEDLKLTKQIQKEIEGGADLVGGVGGGDGTKTPKEKNFSIIPLEKLSSVTKIAEQFKKDSAIISDSFKLIESGAFKAEKSIRDLTLNAFEADFGKSPLEKQLEGIGSAITTLKSSYSQGLIDFASFQSEYENLIKEGNIINALLDLQTGIRQIATEGIEGALSGIGTSIGDALASGENVLSAVGNSVIQSFGSFLGQLGDLLIQYGVAAQVKALLDKAITIPGAGLIAGGAAIAAGIALKAIAGGFSKLGKGGGGGSDFGNDSGPTRRKLPGFANGTNFAPGGDALVGERGPEVIRLPKGSQVIPNHNLKGLSGDTNITLAGNLGISGDQLVFLLDKTRSRQKRLG